LDDAGIRTFGAGKDESAARAPLLLQKAGVSVAVLATFEDREPYRKLDWYAGPKRPGVARMTEASLTENVRQARSRAAVVVVFPHFGKNYRPVTSDQRRLARAAVRAGAHLVIGHGAHMAQEVELIDGAVVIYSVGNFIWHSRGLYREKQVEQRAYALVTRVELDHERIRRITLTPFHVNNRVVDFVPQPVAVERARKLFDEILEPLPGRWRMIDNAAVIELP
jgi:poly-gamma-glutamate capsule biosynthesis protein CapA/YwtB (metallophosphatase superfamily)